jgi:putative transposase
MDVRHTRHTAYQIIYHLVWCPKYRRPVLTGDVSDRLVSLIREIVPELGGEIIELVVRPDHVHLFGHFPPTLAPHQIMARIKGRTSHTLRQEFPSLRSRLPSLWTSAYLVLTDGRFCDQAVRKFIEAQKGT